MTETAPTVFLTTTQAAAHVGVTEKTLRLYSDRGLIRHLVMPSGHRRYRTADLDDFLASRTHPAAGETGVTQ